MMRKFLPQRNLNLWRRLAFGAAGFGLMAACARSAKAQDAPPTVESLSESLAAMAQAIDTTWVIVAAVLVFFMQAGFAYVEGGLTRAKNQNNILMKNLMDFSIGTLSFWLIGFALMFGDGTPYFGTSGFLLGGADNSPATGDAYSGVYSSIAWTGVPLMAKFIFQLVFAATAATIVSGAMAERTKFSSYLLYSVVITALIYPISGHWIWGGGWLASLGFWDFAGSTVVHSVGGWLALVGAAMLGPRLGKYGADGKPRAIPGHSLPMAGLGVFILWLGWFGFNAGSTMGISGGNLGAVPYIAVTTNVSAACGAISAMMMSWLLFKKPDVSITLNGVLAGLVAITAPCPWVSIPSAAIIGLSAGVVMTLAVTAIERAKTDDPVGAIAVHGVCGAFGTLCVGLFAVGPSEAAGALYSAGPEAGLFMGGGIGQLAVQAIGVGAVFAWCMTTGVVLFGAIKLVNGLRVSEAEELEGLDVGEHGATAYPEFGATSGAMGPVEAPPAPPAGGLTAPSPALTARPTEA